MRNITSGTLISILAISALACFAAPQDEPVPGWYIYMAGSDHWVLVAEKGAPVERRYSFSVGIFAWEVKASQGDLSPSEAGMQISFGGATMNSKRTSPWRAVRLPPLRRLRHQ